MTFEMERAFGMIGLAQRAGKLLSGAELCEKAARDGKASLVLIDRQTAAHTQERLLRAAEAGGVPLLTTDEGLGNYIGKPGRMVCAIIDTGFARQIRALIGPATPGSVGNAGV